MSPDTGLLVYPLFVMGARLHDGNVDIVSQELFIVHINFANIMMEKRVGLVYNDIRTVGVSFPLVGPTRKVICYLHVIQFLKILCI